jgi:S1-C subfamily serine protease
MVKTVLVFLLFGSAVLGPASSAQVPSNVLLRVFQIRVGGDSGTTFTIEHLGKQYLVTARHVIATLCPNNVCPNQIEVEISKDQEWRKLKVKPLLPAKERVDIAVLVPDVDVSVRSELPPDSADMYFGQDVYFLGFPQTYDGRILSTSFGTLRVPFMKKGILSAEDTSDPEAFLFYIDGFNNPGFSGGPVVCMNPKTRQWHVFAVVRGYLPTKALSDVNHHFVENDVLVNSGILIAYDIRHAIKAIDEDAQKRR